MKTKTDQPAGEDSPPATGYAAIHVHVNIDLEEMVNWLSQRQIQAAMTGIAAVLARQARQQSNKMSQPEGAKNL